MAAAGRKGHLAVVDMKNMNLIKEIQVCSDPSKLNCLLLSCSQTLDDIFASNDKLAAGLCTLYLENLILFSMFFSLYLGEVI